MLHLIHPALVHFSVAFLVFGALCEAWGLALHRQGAAKFGGVLVLLGAASLLPTLATGYIAANTLNLDAASLALLATHEKAGWAVLGAFVALLVWKGWHRGEIPARQRIAYVTALVLAAALAGFGAFAGGRMVYDRGVGVQVGLLEHRPQDVTGDLGVLP